MSFEFRAHKPSAYYWFAFDLLLLVAVNSLLLYWLNPFFRDINKSVNQSVIFIVPWIVVLFLPTIAGAIFAYRSFIKKFRFTLSEDQFIIESVSKKNISGQKKKILWNEVKGYRSSDFEDNHYFTILFHDKKENLILHRDSGDFENFFSELKKYMNAP